MDDELTAAWEAACGDLDCVAVYQGSILGLNVDAVVSPANSFGFMDGGIDYAYTQFFGPGVQERLQRKIQSGTGELLVGDAETIATFHEQILYLISAPTMRVPMILGPTSINPYLAARAALREAVWHGFDNVAFPGLGTGVGQVPVNICAHQVRVAINEVIVNNDAPLAPTSWRTAQRDHQKLYTNIITDLQYRMDKK